MAIEEQEAVACLHLLIAVAKADGLLHPDERKGLEAALEGIPLLEGSNIDDFLGEPIDVEEEAARIISPEARVETFRACYGLAYADGDCSPRERDLLNELEKLLSIDESDRLEIGRVFHQPSDARTTRHSRIDDADERLKAARTATLKDSMISALLGAFPVPGFAIATDLAVVALQVGLVREIGAMWGKNVAPKDARGLLAALGVGTSARIAVTNIVKMVPGWGSLFGAVTSFASTYAVGVVMQRYYAQGGEGDIAALKDEFERAKEEGRKVYAEQEVDVDEQTKARLGELHEEFKAGRISQADYEERVSQLPG